MKTDAIADEARRRSDDAVRRLREQSGYRVERERRHRAFFSWCALATLASGISLAALDATPDDIDPPLPPAPVIETARGLAPDRAPEPAEATVPPKEARVWIRTLRSHTTTPSAGAEPLTDSF